MLANIISLKKNIIITGSCGKTTTTSLVSKILSESKLDPTIINGVLSIHLKATLNLEKEIGQLLKQTSLTEVFLNYQ